jgi:ubiquinone biosynthesis protein UbiJ
MPPQEETESLKTQADWLKDQLDAINKRIEELESK